MKVSLSRKIHIIALPHGTFLNARWSDDQSATMPCRPSASGSACPVLVERRLRHVDRSPLTMCVQQHGEQDHPDQRAESASTRCTAPRSGGPCRPRRRARTLAVVLAQTHRPPSRCMPCSAVSSIEEREGRIGRREVAPRRLSCCHAQSCPARKARVNTPAAIRPFLTPSVCPRRAAARVHCIATLARTSTPVFSHSTRGRASVVQSASIIRMW